MNPRHSEPPCLQVAFFTLHSRNAAEWSFFKTIDRRLSNGSASVFADEVNTRYGRRWQLVLLVWPRMLLASWRLLRNAKKNKPDINVIVSSDHFQLLWFVLFRRWPGRSETPALTLMGFIYTPRNSQLLTFLRDIYFQFLLKRIDLIIMHSLHEASLLENRFSDSAGKFTAVQYGLGPHPEMEKHVRRIETGEAYRNPNEPVRLFSAGRSARDYATLMDALAILARRMEFGCRIACDVKTLIPEVPPHVDCEVLRNCYGDAYSAELILSDMVIIPLSEGTISAGQMVAQHALCCGKPVVITDTPITREYFHGLDVVTLVPHCDASSIAAAIERFRLVEDQHALSLQAIQVFRERFSEVVFGENVADLLGERFATLQP